MRFVRENACIKPCMTRFLSTQSVFSVVASKPVRNIFTTIRDVNLAVFHAQGKVFIIVLESVGRGIIMCFKKCIIILDCRLQKSRELASSWLVSSEFSSPNRPLASSTSSLAA